MERQQRTAQESFRVLGELLNWENFRVNTVEEGVLDVLGWKRNTLQRSCSRYRGKFVEIVDIQKNNRGANILFHGFLRDNLFLPEDKRKYNIKSVKEKLEELARMLDYKDFLLSDVTKDMLEKLNWQRNTLRVALHKSVSKGFVIVVKKGERGLKTGNTWRIELQRVEIGSVCKEDASKNINKASCEPGILIEEGLILTVKELQAFDSLDGAKTVFNGAIRIGETSFDEVEGGYFIEKLITANILRVCGKNKKTGKIYELNEERWLEISDIIDTPDFKIKVQIYRLECDLEKYEKWGKDLETSKKQVRRYQEELDRLSILLLKAKEDLDKMKEIVPDIEPKIFEQKLDALRAIQKLSLEDRENILQYLTS